VGLRVESRRRRARGGPDGTLWVIEHHLVKNKSGAPVGLVTDRYRGPDGSDPIAHL
jgi:hypothetical protein